MNAGLVARLAPILPALVWPGGGSVYLGCAVVAWLILESCFLYYGFRRFRRLLLSADWAKETGYCDQFEA